MAQWRHVNILCTRVALGVTLALVTGGTALSAQTAAEANLKAITALKCTFSVSSRATWNKDGAPQATIRTTAVLNIQVKDIDALGGTAVVSTVSTGNDVNVQVSDKYLHFIEASRAGRLAMTTVFAEYSTGTKLKAVHSRTDYLPIDLGPAFRSEPEVSFYAGECEATR